MLNSEVGEIRPAHSSAGMGQKITMPSSLVETLRGIHSRGFFLVPEIKGYAPEDACAYRLVPLSDAAKKALPFENVLSRTVHPRFALDTVSNLALDSEANEDEFRELLDEYYPNLARESPKPLKDKALRGFSLFGEIAAA